MAKPHKHAGASASIKTDLDPARIAEIVEQAAKRAETLQVMVRLEESTPGRLVYSTRNRLVGGAVEFMTFEVTMKGEGAVRTVRTRILRYKQKRQWLIVIPLPWQMVAWSTYRKFMYGLADGVRAHDAISSANVVELAGV